MTTTLTILALVVLLVAVLLRANLQSVTVFEYERGLRFHRGKFVGVSEPGKYWLWMGRGYIRKVDTRLRVVSSPGRRS